MFLNTLRCNHFTNKEKKKKQNNGFFNTRLARIFVVIEVKTFTVVVLDILDSILKMYFIYFTNSLYNTPTIKWSIFLSLHLK